MSILPLTEVVIYKHGLAHLKRRGNADHGPLRLAVSTSSMDAVLKSLTLIQHGSGTITAVRFPSHESDMDDLPVLLHSDQRETLRNLLQTLVGRQVSVAVGQSDKPRSISGRVIGVEESSQDGDSLVLLGADGQIRALRLSQLATLRVLDSQASAKLTRVLDAAVSQSADREFVIDLSEGAHDLEVRYNVAAPPWRVTYRVVAETHHGLDAGQLQLQGWAIVDNTTSEDWTDVRLKLVAGQPKEQNVNLYQSQLMKIASDEGGGGMGGARKRAMAAPMRAQAEKEPALVSTAPTSVTDMSELFEYAIDTPVSVRQGETAFVPFLSASMSYQRDLIYDIRGYFQKSPVAALRFTNGSAYTLEAGVAILIENGVYKGEANLGYTRSNTEIVLAYADEKGITVQTQQYHKELEGELRISAGLPAQIGVEDDPALAIQETILVVVTELSIDNNTDAVRTMTIEAAPATRGQTFKAVDAPRYQDSQTARWSVELPSRQTTQWRLERHEVRSARVTLDALSGLDLERFKQVSLVNEDAYKRLREIVDVRQRLTKLDERIAANLERQEEFRISNADIRETLRVLLSTDEVLRADMLEQLAANNQHIQTLVDEMAALRRSSENGRRKLMALIRQLGQ